MSGHRKTSGVFVFGSPVAVGHVHPLMPLAKRLVERGFAVVWAISGTEHQPASLWKERLVELGVEFVDVDQTAPFVRETSAELAPVVRNVFRRVLACANDVAEGAASAIAETVGGRPMVGGIYDFFAVWSYVAMRRLGIADIDVLISAFPTGVMPMPSEGYRDPVYVSELARLRSAGFGAFDEPPRLGMIPRDPAMRMLCFTSRTLCPNAPDDLHLLGVQEALPPVEVAAAPDDQALVRRLLEARASGPVLLMSMGTMVMRNFSEWGSEYVAFLKHLYSSIAASALRSGAVVIASTCHLSATDLGVDEVALGAANRERIIAMPFVPQSLLFAHGVIDVMLMHGGANTFHEAVVAGVPMLICPGFGDQAAVALSAATLGVAVCVQSITHPSMVGAISVEHAAAEVLPEMLASNNRWKAAATTLAARINRENGLDAAESFVLGPR